MKVRIKVRKTKRGCNRKVYYHRPNRRSSIEQKVIILPCYLLIQILNQLNNVITKSNGNDFLKRLLIGCDDNVV